jgi:predicted  nucleic acid-binding Zn-ribbon protein
MSNLINVSEATTTELVAFYNSIVAADKQIKKFADRKTAERRVAELVASLPVAEVAGFNAPEAPAGEVAPEGVRVCPHCGDTGSLYHVDDCAANTDKTYRQLRDADFEAGEFWCVACGGHSGAPVIFPAKSTARAEGVARSWQDAEVAARRAVRDKVEVDGALFKSVAAAFKALGLPMKEHISFRMSLKAAGSTRCYDRNWKIVKG